MELIKEIFETDLQLNNMISEETHFRLRRAARGLVFNDKKIAMLNAVNLHLHKLPGGGIEDIESVEDGFRREILEETGCKIEIDRALGITIEYRKKQELLQISYVYVCKVIVITKVLNLTEKEKDEGFELVWLTVEEAINLMKKNDRPDTYAGKFILKRDLAILDYYLKGEG